MLDATTAMKMPSRPVKQQSSAVRGIEAMKPTAWTCPTCKEIFACNSHGFAPSCNCSEKPAPTRGNHDCLA